MMPLQALTILIPNLWSLSIDQIPIFATIEPNFHLFLVEGVKPCPESILQARHVTLRMENLPRFNACVAFTRLQYEHESIQAIEDLLGSGAQECNAGLRIIMREEVVQLSRVRLNNVSIKLINNNWDKHTLIS
jgi:hypothetical protein